jgi:hypothetical protein
MAGYRERSNYDPYGAVSRPARPFTWVQWTGVAMLCFSVALNLGFLAGEAGWLPRLHIAPSLAPAPMIFGVLLMNSRREPAQDPAPELASARRKWMTITVAAVAVILAAATLIDIARS